jgi:hypothetical protein
MLKNEIAATGVVLIALLVVACSNVVALRTSGFKIQVIMELSSDTVVRGDEVTIFVVVKDDGGNPIEGATVTATIGDLEVLFILSDQGDGNYQVAIDTSIVREGTCDIVVTVEKEGYEPSQTSQTLTVISSLITDLNNDGGIDILDVAIAASAFGTEPGDLRWREEADVNDDDKINILDLAKITVDFGRTSIPSGPDVIKLIAFVNGMRYVSVFVRVNISDGLTREEAEQITDATFIEVMGEEITYQLDTLTFNDTQIEAHYTWGVDESDMGHIFDMTADLTTLQITVNHCF